MIMAQRLLLRVSGWIETALRRVAHLFAWTLLLLVLVVCVDVLTRRLGWRIPGLDSTRLQELGWHLQAIVFCTWLGHAYVRNAHVRVDILSSRFAPRTRCMIEIAGCLFFALPYLLIALPYAQEFLLTSWRQGESSGSPGGLPHRWIVKGVLYLSFWGLLLATLAVLMRNLASLLGGGPDAEEAARG